MTPETTQQFRARLLSPEINQTLKEFLLGREADIANDFEDFGMLQTMFIELFEREAK